MRNGAVGESKVIKFSKESHFIVLQISMVFVFHGIPEPGGISWSLQQTRETVTQLYPMVAKQAILLALTFFHLSFLALKVHL